MIKKLFSIILAVVFLANAAPSYSADTNLKYYLGPWVQDTTVTGHLKWMPPQGANVVIDLRSIPAHQTPGVALFAVADNVTLGAEYLFLGRGQIDQIAPRASIRAAFAAKLNLPTVSGSTLQEWLWDVLTLRADPTGQTGPKPLMPTRELKLELHTNGKVKQKDFRLDMPEAAPVIAVMQEDYRAIRKEGKEGKISGLDGVVDLEFHRRVLDSWAEKFKVSNPEDYFIPSGIPKEKRLPHASSYSESFNKADAGTLGPDLTWTEGIGGSGTNWQVVSNQAKVVAGDTSDNHARAEHDTSSSDMFVQVTIADHQFTSWPNWSVGGGMGRYSASALTAYSLQAMTWGTPGHPSNGYSTYKWVDGVETGALGLANGRDIVDGDVARLEISGSTLTAKVNGSQVYTFTDTSITSGTRAGMRGIKGDSNAVLIHDVFSFGDLTEPAASGQVIWLD